ncbi:hypothetical protein ABIA16_003569 [Sinorhizobium fredii]
MSKTTTKRASPADFAAAMKSNRKDIEFNGVAISIRPMTTAEVYMLMERVPGGLEFVQKLIGDSEPESELTPEQQEERFRQRLIEFTGNQLTIEAMLRTNVEVLAFIVSCCFDQAGDEDFMSDFQTWDEDAQDYVVQECIAVTLGGQDIFAFFTKKFQLWQRVGLVNHMPKGPEASETTAEPGAQMNRKDQRKVEAVKRKAA